MKKLHVLAVALLAVFAFGAYAASSAFAVAEWLFKGAKFAGELLTETNGSLLLRHLAGGFFEPEVSILCDGIFDGVILGGAGADGLGGEDLVTELLSLTANTPAISSTNPIECELEVGPCLNGTILVYPENLPWLTKLELMLVTGTSIYLDLFTEDTETWNGLDEHLPAYHIECTDELGAHHVTLCEGETSAELTLSGTQLLGFFHEEELELEKLEGLCEEGGTDHANVALQEGEGVITDGESPTEEIDVSE